MSWSVIEIARVLAWLAVGMQIIFAALEIFIPRWVFRRVFASYASTSDSSVWLETEKLARNMGLYNAFLGVGLLLSQLGKLGDVRTSQFFLFCVAIAGAFGLLSVRAFWAFGVQLVLGLVPFILFLLWP
jgi:uncharacterized membrane protein